jgi:hypothetical protein
VIAAPVVNNTAINAVFCLHVLFGVSTGAISSVVAKLSRANRDVYFSSQRSALLCS